MEESRLQPERPSTDDEYLEILALSVFRAGLDWRMVTRKWPAFRRAFDGFEVEKAANYTPLDVERLLGDEGIIRNRRKIEATIHNAGVIRALADEHGSFASYIRSADRLGWQALVEDMVKRFKHLGTATALHFLRNVGEDVPRSLEPRSRG